MLITATDLMAVQFLVPHVEHLTACGWQISLACSEVGGRFAELAAALPPEVALHKVSLRRSPFSVTNLRGLRQLKKQIEPGKYDVIWTNEPVMGVNFVVADEKARFDVYTRDLVYHLSGTAVGKMMSTQTNGDFIATATNVDSVEPNVLGYIPIIEYRYNDINTSAFELALPMLDALSSILSNRVDGVEQFIQSLAVAVNCNFDDGVTANEIRKAGMIVLKSVGENKADFRILSEQLDQQQTQTLTDYIYSQVQRICAIPFVDRQGRSYDSTGAAAMVTSGWYQAASAARNTEDQFKKSNRQFECIIVDILRRKGIMDISLNDFELNMSREDTSNIQSKAQAFQTLMAAGLAPELAAKKSGVSNDPVSDMKMSEKYITMIWGDPNKVDKAESIGNAEEKTTAEGEAEIVESDAFNGEDQIGGAV
jgi:hypothetical protein